MPNCGEKTSLRISDLENTKRKDFCLPCGLVCLREYGDKVVLVDTWNEVTKDDVMNGVEKLKRLVKHVR